MKIAFISQLLDRVTPPAMNSIGIWTNEISRSLAKNHEVIVYARKGLYDRKGIGDNVQTHYITSIPYRWNGQVDRLLSRYSQPDRPFFSSPFYNLEYILQIALDIRRQKVDVVHLQNYSQFVPILRAFNPGVKIALHMRCEWLTQLNYKMIDRRLKQADLIFGISSYITGKISRRFPQYAPRCATIANGVDVDRFCPPAQRSPEPPRTILMVGRISPEKGVHVLLDAFQNMSREFPEVLLQLVGSIRSVSKDYIVSLSEENQVAALSQYYRHRYIDDLKSLIPAELENRIHFTGAIDYEHIVPYYQRAYLLANPSLSESFGRSLIEANACGVPVIAARAGGMTDIIEPGCNGLLVEPGDARSLEDAFRLLLGNPDLRQEIGARGREHVLQHFSWTRIAQNLIQAYQAN